MMSAPWCSVAEFHFLCMRLIIKLLPACTSHAMPRPLIFRIWAYLTQNGKHSSLSEEISYRLPEEPQVWKMGNCFFRAVVRPIVARRRGYVVAVEASRQYPEDLVIGVRFLLLRTSHDSPHSFATPRKTWLTVYHFLPLCTRRTSPILLHSIYCTSITTLQFFATLYTMRDSTTRLFAIIYKPWLYITYILSAPYVILVSLALVCKRSDSVR